MEWKERADAAEHRLRGLFVLALAGDSTAYHAFLKDLSAHLRAFLRKRMSRSPDDVEDLVQEALLAIHANRHTYRPDQPLTAWVHTIARYKMIDLLRSRARTDAFNDPLDEELDVFARADTQEAHAGRDLHQLLQTLPERQRRAVVMTKLEGASVAETAAAINQSESAVKTSVHRSLKTLAARVRRSA